MTIDPENKTSYHTFASYAQQQGIDMRKQGVAHIVDLHGNKSEYEEVYDYVLW